MHHPCFKLQPIRIHTFLLCVVKVLPDLRSCASVSLSSKSFPSAQKRSTATYCSFTPWVLLLLIWMNKRWVIWNQALRTELYLLLFCCRAFFWFMTSPTTRVLRIWRTGSAWWRRPTKNRTPSLSSPLLGTKVRITHAGMHNAQRFITLRWRDGVFLMSHFVCSACGGVSAGW